MRSNSIQFEFASANKPARRDARLQVHGTPTSRRESPMLSAEVLDEAIAAFERIDAPRTNNSVEPTFHHGNWREKNESLVSNLASQLKALDQQREHLATLLRTID